MKYIKTFDEFIDTETFDERLSIMDFIELLLEEEHNSGYDNIDEGWSFGSRGRGSDRTFKFTPGKNDTDITSTEIFNDDKKFKYHEILLPKSGVMSYNLYKISDMRISKALKHPQKFKDMEKRNIDFDSIEKFMQRTSLYIYSILKHNPVDIITYPQSSSEFNKDMVDHIMKRMQGAECIPNLMVKNVDNVYVNFTVAKELGLTDKEINQLRHDIENWQKDADIYKDRLKIDELKDSIAYKLGKRGRPSKEIMRVKEEIKALEELIRIKRKGRKGRDKTIDSEGRAKNFEIKSIEDRRRRSLEGLFGINPKLNGIQQNLKGKHIVVFDDNISSGATLDDICLELQKYGVASILPITLAIIPKTVYGDKHESLKDK